MINPKRKKPHVDRKRIKKRYVLLEIETHRKSKITSENLKKALDELILECWGLVGSTLFENELRVKYYNPSTRVAIIKIPFPLQDMFVKMISEIKMINDNECTVDVLHVSGTVIRVEMEAKERNIEIVKELKLKNVNVKVKINHYN
eukprot:gene11050-3758_t